MVTTIKQSKPLITRTVLATAVAGLFAMPASAEHSNRYRNYQPAAMYDYAQVVDVNPVVERYQVSDPVERCWDERVPVRHRSAGHRKDSKTPEILGAIIGGAIANQVGKRGGGKARDVATVAGAVLGGSIGRDIKHNNRYQGGYEQVRYETVQRCEVTENVTTREQVVGYDVAYKYRGEVFHTQMDQHPGRKIRVKISVDPV